MSLLAFVGTAEPALTVVDVTNPASPTFVTSIPTDMLTVLAYQRGILHAISLAADSLTCIRAAARPSVLGRISGLGPPNYLNGSYNVVIAGNYAYIAVQTDDGLTIIRTSDPTNPTYAGGIYGAGAPNYLGSQRTVAMLDSTHCCLTGWAGVDRAFSVVDVSNPAAPVIVGQDRNWAYVNVDMVISGTRAYMTDNSTDLSIVDVSNPLLPTLISDTALFPGGSNRLCVVGNYAYVTDWSSHTLYIVDVSNPLLPFVAGSIGGAGPPNYLNLAWDVCVRGNIAYVTGNLDSSLVCIDVSNPVSPTLLGVIRGAGAPNYLLGPQGVWVGGLPTVVTRPATGVR